MKLGLGLGLQFGGSVGGTHGPIILTISVNGTPTALTVLVGGVPTALTITP